jgi:paxillin
VCNCYVVDEGSVALGTTYHPWCLVCSHCGEQLTSTVHKNAEGKLFCEQDFLALCAYTCGRCEGVIEAESVSALDKHWHPWCFTCSHEGCGLNLAEGEGGFHEVDGMPYCRPHYADVKGDPCAKCGRGIMPGEALAVMKKLWHPECLSCMTCGKHLSSSDKIYPRDDNPTCEDCFMEAAEKCAACRKPIIGKFLTVLGRKYHATGCLGCGACLRPFGTGEKMFQRDGWPVCGDHARGELTAEQIERMAAIPAAGGGGAGGAGGGAGAPPPPSAPPPPPPA